MTAIALPAPARPASRPRFVHLALVHAKYQLLEGVRTPIAVCSTMFFPAMAMLFFVVPQPDVAGNAAYATAATGQLLLFSAMSTALFTFGNGIADDRAHPWDTFVRTLPVGPGPRMLGRVLGAIPFSFLGFIPLIAVAALLTAATATPVEILLALGALAAGALPFTAMAFAVGYSLSPKSAIAVVQLLLFPLAFAGGLFIPPQTFPHWLDSLSGWLPSRAGRDLVVSALTHEPVRWQSIAVLAGWTVLCVALALVAYRRDAKRSR